MNPYARPAIGGFWTGVTLCLGNIGYRSIENHYRQSGDWEGALRRGLVATRRWWVWMFYMIASVVWTGIFTFVQVLFFVTRNDPSYTWDKTAANHAFWPTLLGLIFAFFALGIVYCRNVDSSLFQRRFLYRVWSPLYRVFEWCPSFVWYYIPFVIAMKPHQWDIQFGRLFS